MTVLKVDNLTMSYGGKTVIDNISFSVEKGEYLCIVGDNGVGKSTLLKGILGLCPTVFGNIELNLKKREKEIGYLPQQKDIQKNFPCLVKEVILSGFLNGKGIFPFIGKSEKKKAHIVAAKYGVEGLSDTPYSHLSGGQKQRVLLARAECAAKSVLFLDEPATSLDASSAKMLYENLSNLKNDGMTIVSVTHDISEALANADRILHIGNRNFFGTTQEYAKFCDNGGNTLC